MENDFYKDLVGYFNETPKEKIMEDWNKSKEYDNIGITVDEFLSTVKKKVYQIKCIGHYKNIEGEGKFNSKQIYVNYPTQEQINDFVDRCCNSEHPHSLYDLDINNIKTIVLELELI
jgi:hypothetical protein